MLSNKSQYILSKIGIPLYQDNTKSLIKQESAIHFYQKDSILTLHLISVDKYSEKEINLLEAIMGSMKGEQASESHGEFTFVEGESVRCEKILNNNHPIKATLVLVVAGTLAGLFPAIKATSISPIEALRDQ